MSYEGKDLRSRRLHLDPTVSWGHILTTIMMLCAALAAWVSMGERLTQAESGIAHNKELIQIQNKQNEQGRRELMGAINNINEKLDRLIQSRFTQ